MNNLHAIQANELDLNHIDDGDNLALFDDYIKDCALGSDEVGNLIICETAVADFLRKEAA